MENDRTQDSHGHGLPPSGQPESIDHPSSGRHDAEDLSAACRDILDNINDGVYMINPDGFLTYLNSTTLKRTFLSPENYWNRHTLDLIAPEDRTTLRARQPCV